ncbi:MAG: hypothetical protein LQ342_003547 [Letrouitia transgressa]|nr:MAG: hypothetical protein LQ342_003547 [Letrouitia transgressa]
MCDVAPVTNRGSDEADMDRARVPYRTRVRQEELMCKRWAQLWRTIILSSLKKTIFPYSRYIRSLNLEDLEELFQDPKFKDQANDMFFSNELADYKVETKVSGAYGRTRLDLAETLIILGEVITKESPMLEELSGKISTDALLRWAPRLPRLRHLNLWSGGALVGAGASLSKHCHDFRSLNFWSWVHEDADQKFADFLNEIRPQSLESLEIFSYSGIGAESFLALSCHRDSLRELKLDSISADAMRSLNMLQGCTNLTTLSLTDGSQISVDLKKSHNDVFLEVVAWLRKCQRLQSVTLRKIRAGPDLVTPILLEDGIKLTNLELGGYAMADSREFHQALANQVTLQELLLTGECDNETGDGTAILVESLSQLTNLTDLRLRDISDYFNDEVIQRLARSLPKLEVWWTSGWAITDAIWEEVAKLKSLRRLDFTALTRFTANGILDFILNLGPGNHNFVLAVMMADLDCDLSEAEQTMIRETMAERVSGRFEFQLYRGTVEGFLDFLFSETLTSPDPDVSEFEGESD